MPKSNEPDTSLLEQLGAPFPADQVKQKSGPGGKTLDYISWDLVVRRLNEVAKDSWEFWPAHTSYDPSTGVAIVCGILQIEFPGYKKSRRMGIGANKNERDPDMAVKTAQAEALKKAANLFGIGLELWDADYRQSLVEERSNIAQLKTEVYELALNKLQQEKATAEEVANLFGVAKEDLQDPAVLRSILLLEQT